MIYYLIIVTLFLFSLMYQIDEKRVDYKMLAWFCLVAFLIIGGLRDGVGMDWDQYQRSFEKTETSQDVSEGTQEPLFMMLMFVVRNIWNNFYFFSFLFFAVSFYLKFRFFRTYSSDIFLSLIIYCFTIFMIYDVNAIRQGMAMGLILLSVKPILERKFLPFAIILTIAAFFHTSAIIFIPFYWLSQIKYSDKSIWWIAIGIIVVSVPIRYALENAAIIQNLMQLEMFTHYNYYLDNDEAGRSLPIISIAVFQRLFILFLFLFFLKKIKVDKDFKYLLFNGYLIATTIYLIFSFNAEFSARLSFYYKSLEMIIIPLIVSAQKEKKYSILLLCVFLVLALFGANRLLAITQGGLLPYNSLLW
jgi:hypothetical protein